MKKKSVQNKTVVFFGIYDPEYSRNRILINGFREQGFSVTHCRIDPRGLSFFKKSYLLFKKSRDIAKRFVPEIVIVAFPGHTVLWIARLVFGPTVIFDAFLSLYDSNVRDRKVYSKIDPRAWRDWVYDWLGFRLPQCALLDTEQHILFAQRAFGADASKLSRVLIGADERVFFPRETAMGLGRRDPREFIIHFHGMFIPLQGVEFIIRAAALLRNETDIVFNILGNGQTFKYAHDLVSTLDLKNIRLLGPIPFSEVPEYIASADVCLGIFGDTEKTYRVIPNKVYECAAMKKAIITADTPAIVEVFEGGRDMLLCKAADAQSLAQSILELKSDSRLRHHLAAGAYAMFRSRASTESIVTALLTDIYAKRKE